LSKKDADIVQEVDAGHAALLAHVPDHVAEPAQQPANGFPANGFLDHRVYPRRAKGASGKIVNNTLIKEKNPAVNI